MKQNIYQMYVANGNQAGFWVRRNSWSARQAAQVLTIGGQSSGPLEGDPPYFGNPIVVGSMNGRTFEISSPGSYAYTQV